MKKIIAGVVYAALLFIGLSAGFADSLNTIKLNEAFGMGFPESVIYFFIAVGLLGITGIAHLYVALITRNVY